MAESPKCEVCLDLDRRHYDSKIRHTASGSKVLLGDLLQSAGAGCLGCGVLVKAIRHHAPEQIRSPEPYELSMYEERGFLIIAIVPRNPRYIEARGEDGDANMMEGEDQRPHTLIELFSQDGRFSLNFLVPRN
jgi:hypothetical protein